MEKDKPNACGQVQRSDYLPDGINDERYLKEDKEWPTLEDRLGQPRISKHYFIYEVLDWIKQKENPDDFFYLDAGCGHGNDLRDLRKTLNCRGHFLGIDLSRAEIMRGLEFYGQKYGQNAAEYIKLFGLGNLHNLHQIFTWDEKKENFSSPKSIRDNEVDLIYMEAVLQASGYGYNTYQEKKESAQLTLNELSRVCKAEGKFLGRTMVFTHAISKEQQFDVLREYGNWQFIPELGELRAMLKEAGFNNIKSIIHPHEKAATNLSRKDVVKVSFLAQK